MLTHPQFDPILFSLGPLAIRWYGLMYVVAFIAFLLLTKLRVKRGFGGAMSVNDVDDLLFYGVLGVILGGRLGYVLFYKADYYLAHPLEILQVWTGGMSFHGGFLGVLVAVAVFCWRKKLRWIEVMDLVAPAVPVGLGAGRMGNFINGELPGRPTDVPWGMWFPQIDREPLARHPSQLYQFACEGVILFVLLWWFASRPRPAGAVSAFFLLGYGTLRFISEFGRQPDDFLGLLAFNLSMGQWLSIPMVAAGVGMMIWAYKRKSGSG
ncbi:prolipoprotein diacylglyceryl transferase [Betaproteobacteria bacterium GR16-43]|nr:prolipoprotein diacylglyceryl transferase [Betaproteobacteria bacterium GR16-43]